MEDVLTVLIMVCSCETKDLQLKNVIKVDVGEKSCCSDVSEWWIYKFGLYDTYEGTSSYKK